MRYLITLTLALLLALPAAADIQRAAGGGAAGGSVATNAVVEPFALDYAGALYFTSPTLNIVQRILADNTLEDVAGTTLRDQPGAPPTGSALATSLRPSGIALTPGGTAYVVAGRTIRRVNGPDIETFTSPGGAVALLSPVGATASASFLYVADPGVGKVYRYPLACSGPTCQPDRTIAGLSIPYDVAVSDDDATLYVLEQTGRVKRINPDGTATLVAGGSTNPGSGVPALSARFATPTGFCMAPGGDLYVADTVQNRVAKISGGLVTTVAGTGAQQSQNAWVEVGAGQPATAQPITRPDDCAVSDDGRVLYVASGSDKRIYRVDLTTAAPTMTATQPPASTATVAPATLTASPSRTATALPTATRTAPPTFTAPPTATATVRQCGPGEAPSCERGPML